MYLELSSLVYLVCYLLECGMRLSCHLVDHGDLMNY